MSAIRDVRRMNWWYVLPPATGPVLLVGDAAHMDAFSDPIIASGLDESLRAVAATRYGGIAVPDLDAVFHAGPSEFDGLRTLMAAVEPGGWFYGGFSNRPLRRKGLSLGRVRTLLHLAGMRDHRVFLAAPDHVTPAYLIPAARRAEMDFFLRMFFFPYSRASGTRAAVRRMALRFLRVGTSVSPAWLRARVWPSVAVVARKEHP
ncbi:MAG TPA: hypothetical protein VM841_10480 [Actinomycetota bacterium]|nr:hypothetical protein [Actinomycetota bacterium]